MSTVITITLLPDTGEWVIEIIISPPRLILSWLTPETHSCKNVVHCLGIMPELMQTKTQVCSTGALPDAGAELEPCL